jgi:hypothetical protein
VNVVSLTPGVAAWAPDGRSIVVAERDDDEPGYNGDPERVGDRMASESFAPTQPQRSVRAPVAPDESPATVTVGATLDRAARKAAAIDRARSRMDEVY